MFAILTIYNSRGTMTARFKKNKFLYIKNMATRKVLLHFSKEIIWERFPQASGFQNFKQDTYFEVSFPPRKTVCLKQVMFEEKIETQPNKKITLTANEFTGLVKRPGVNFTTYSHSKK